MKKHYFSSMSSSARVATVVLMLAACNEYPLHDLGNTVTPSSPGAPDPDPGVPVADHISDLAGVWLGQAEDPFAAISDAEQNPPVYRLPSGSTHIWLRIADNDEEPSGTLTFGDAPAPPPAVDGDLGYPVDEPPPADPLSSDGSIRPPLEGFPYTLTPVGAQRDVAALGGDELDNYEFLAEGGLIDGKLQADFMPTEVYASWCPLQTTESCVFDQYSVDDDGLCYGGSDLVPVDCGKLNLCASEVCTCTPGYPCSYSIQLPAELIVRLSNDGLVGLFSGAVFLNERGFQQPLGAVHFRRVDASPTP